MNSNRITLRQLKKWREHCKVFNFVCLCPFLKLFTVWSEVRSRVKYFFIQSLLADWIWVGTENIVVVSSNVEKQCRSQKICMFKWGSLVKGADKEDYWDRKTVERDWKWKFIWLDLNLTCHIHLDIYSIYLILGRT